MLNRSRKVHCPECGGANFWKGDPRLSDELHCRYCDAVVITYEDYIQQAIHQEAQRLLAAFTESDSPQDLAFLKGDLAKPERARA